MKKFCRNRRFNEKTSETRAKRANGYRFLLTAADHVVKVGCDRKSLQNR